ncbi:MAG TPA: O-antigen ligase family protein [Candidatus Binatia bacterium]|nr:O-antigen ligase family protein [Candidatus Binatia bacterium]
MRARSSRGTVAERLVCAYVTAIPVLWVIGLTLPAAFVLFGGLALGIRNRRAIAYAAPWILVGCCQLASVVVNLLREGQPLATLPRHVVASYVSGWFLAGAAIAVGASGAVHREALLAAVRRFAITCFVVALGLYPFALESGEREFLLTPTPVGSLLPDDLPAKKFSFSMLLFAHEDLFGVELPRMSVFHPWSTALGFNGVAVVLLVLGERDRRRRRLGLTCGAFMVAASLGRMAMVALVAALAVRWLIRRPPAVLVPVVCAVLLAVVVGWMTVVVRGESPGARIAEARDAFENTRPGASEARELIYEETWDGFLAAPVLGHGWPGESVYPSEYELGATMLVGTHSTFTGLLYLGGIVTFAAFLFALLRTAMLLVVSRADPALARDALALLLALALASLSDSLQGIVLPSVFVFVWFGLALARCRGSAAVPS